MCFRIVGDVCDDDDDFFFSFFGKDDGEDERVRFSRCCAFVLARKIDDNVEFGRGKVGRRSWAELESVASSTAEVVGVDASMVEVEVVESTANTGAELGSEEEVTTVNLQATINCIDSDVSASVTSKLNSLTEEDELKIATEAKIEGATSATGHLEETKILEWEKEETPSAPPAYDGPFLDCDATVDDEGYYLVFKHDSSKGNYWSKANNNAESKRIGSNPETDYKYSRLEEVEKFGRTDEGSFQFKLEYPTLSQTNIWTQTSNPVTAGKRGVDDFKAISIQANGHGTSTHSFKGLEYNNGGSNFIDGTVDHGNWFFSIGAYKAWGGTNKFPGPSSGVNMVKLWVKTSAKKPDSCALK